MLKQIFLCYCVLWSYTLALSQNTNSETYSLEACITLALENNLDLKASKFSEKTAAINFKQSKDNRLPRLNANYNLGLNIGRSIDPFTNTFTDQQLTFSNAQLSLDYTVFNGFRLMNTLKQQQLNQKAAEMETEAMKQDLYINVTLAYLQVLNNKDVLLLAKNRVEATEKQLKRQEKFFNEGAGNPTDYTDLLAQKAIDETTILNAETSLNTARLSLKNWLNVDIITIEKLEIESFESYPLAFDQVYQEAMENLSIFKARQLRIQAAEKGIDIVKAQGIPTVSLFAGASTSYSSAAESFSPTGNISVIETDDYVLNVNGDKTPVFQNRTEFNSNKINYFSQFENNFNTNIGVAVRIPIFNAYEAKNNLALEKIGIDAARNDLENSQLEVKQAIEQVYFDMETSYKRTNSFRKQVEAYEESYRVNEILFNNGVSNFLAYITSKNNLENAQLNLINSKYDYLLKVKILEIYRGQL